MREVAWRRCASALGPADADAVARQLGFCPWNAHSVAARDRESGLPTVLQMYPLSAELSVSRGSSAAGRGSVARVQPWPTLFWLVCPILRAEVSKLEAVGLIPLLHSAVAASAPLSAAMARAHSSYASQRWSSLVEPDVATVRELGWAARLLDTGVGGVSDRSQLKCLHAHLGHELATGGNPTGGWVALALRERLSDAAVERQRRAHLRAAGGLDAVVRATALALLASVADGLAEVEAGGPAAAARAPPPDGGASEAGG